MRTVFYFFGRGLYYFFECFLAFVVCYLWLFLSGSLFSVGSLNTDGDIAIYVRTNGVHTDFCMPVISDNWDWSQMIPINDFPKASGFNYIAIGWGDKGFFLDTPEWSDLTFKTAMNAAFLPSGTAMHVAYLNRAPQISESVAEVYINESQLKELITFISSTFKVQNENVVLIPNRGYWNNDNFYEANGNYHLFKTCNSWTNQALKSIGVKTGWYALSSDGIMWHLK